MSVHRLTIMVLVIHPFLGETVWQKTSCYYGSYNLPAPFWDVPQASDAGTIMLTHLLGLDFPSSVCLCMCPVFCDHIHLLQWEAYWIRRSCSYTYSRMGMTWLEGRSLRRVVRRGVERGKRRGKLNVLSRLKTYKITLRKTREENIEKNSKNLPFLAIIFTELPKDIL